MVQAHKPEPMPRNRKRKPLDLMNQTQAAALIGVSRPTIPAMVARGELVGEVHGGFLLISRASAEAARDQREAMKTAKEELAA